MLASFLYGLPVGAIFAWVCLETEKATLTIDVVTALLAVMVIALVGSALIVGERQLAVIVGTVFLVFVGPPVAGFVVGALGGYGIAKYMKRR